MRTVYNFQYKGENLPKLTKSAAMGFISKGLKNKFETPMVNKPSVFELLKLYWKYKSNKENTSNDKDVNNESINDGF